MYTRHKRIGAGLPTEPERPELIEVLGAKDAGQLARPLVRDVVVLQHQCF
jgi:hypothetical protein